jgi:hypothetical protein
MIGLGFDTLNTSESLTAMTTTLRAPLHSEEGIVGAAKASTARNRT